MLLDDDDVSLDVVRAAVGPRQLDAWDSNLCNGKELEQRGQDPNLLPFLLLLPLAYSFGDSKNGLFEDIVVEAGEFEHC